MNRRTGEGTAPAVVLPPWSVSLFESFFLERLLGRAGARQPSHHASRQGIGMWKASSTARAILSSGEESTT